MKKISMCNTDYFTLLIEIISNITFRTDPRRIGQRGSLPLLLHKPSNTEQSFQKCTLSKQMLQQAKPRLSKYYLHIICYRC